MKRIISIALCALLLLGLLPVYTPPAEAITFAGVIVNKYTAYVGDTITWTVYNEFGVGPFRYQYNLFIDGSLANSDGFHLEQYQGSYTTYRPGIYSVVITIKDDHDSTTYKLISPGTIVSYRAAPKITKVEALGGTSLKVTWSKVSGASGYNLHRSTSKTGAYTKIGVTIGTSFTNTGLTAGKSYFYKVECFNLVDLTNRVSSGFSVVAAGVPLAKPAAPAAKVLSRTSVKLSWSAVTGATGYELWRAVSASGTYARVYRGTARTFTNTALKAGKTYYYKVRALKKIGTVSCYGPLSVYKSVRPK